MKTHALRIAIAAIRRACALREWGSAARPALGRAGRGTKFGGWRIRPNTPQDLSKLDAALAQGKMVIANGDYYASGVPGRNGAKMAGHFCLVTGKDAQGNYLVNDPWKGEKVKFSPQAMLNYFKEHRVSDNSRRGAMIIVEKSAAAGAPAAPSTPAAPPASPTGAVAPAGLRYDGGKTYNRDVEQLQKQLVQAGYLDDRDRKGGPGFYGNKTAAAVAKLQREFSVPGDGRTFDAATRSALEKKLAGTAPTPPATPAPQGDYERAVASAIANAPKDNKQLRPYWANFAADNVAPRLEALGVPRDQIKKAILWGLTEGTSTVGTNGKYRLENGNPSSAITYSNLGDNAQINGSTQTPSGLKADGTPFKYWQVGIAGVQVKEAVQNGWLKDAFQKLYPGQTPQQVGQRMLEMMGETHDKTFPNLSIDQLTQMKGDTMVNGKWAAILLRDPAINVLAMTNHGGLDKWLGVNRDRLEKESPGFYASLVNTVDKAFD